jgi:tetratricopeptide (TPR) repeat protein
VHSQEIVAALFPFQTVKCPIASLANQVAHSKNDHSQKPQDYRQKKKANKQVGDAFLLRSGLRDAEGHNEAVYDTIKPLHGWIVTLLLRCTFRSFLMQNIWFVVKQAIPNRIRVAQAALLLLPFFIANGGAVAQQVPSPSPVPADYSAQLSEARQLLGSGDYAGADRALRAILVAAPRLAEAHFLLGSALLYEQKAAEALTEYTQGAKFHEPGPEDLVGVSLAYLQLKDLPDAEHWLTAAAKQSPERSLIWYLLGKVQYGQGHGEDAARSLLTCLRLSPHHLQAQYTLGLVYELLKRPDAAAEAYRTAITWQEAASVKELGPYLALGMLLRSQGKATEALPLLVAATGNGSRDPLAYQELGLAYEQLGRYNDAAGELKAAIAIDPHNEALHFFLGRVDRKGGQKDEAAREFALAVGSMRKQSDMAVVKH